MRQRVLVTVFVYFLIGAHAQWLKYQPPIDAIGHPRSEAMHVTERYHRRDYGHLDTELTFDDPQMYTRKFSVKIAYNLVPDDDIFEIFYTQNEEGPRSHGEVVTPPNRVAGSSRSRRFAF